VYQTYRNKSHKVDIKNSIDSFLDLITNSVILLYEIFFYDTFYGSKLSNIFKNFRHTHGIVLDISKDTSA